MTLYFWLEFYGNRNFQSESCRVFVHLLCEKSMTFSVSKVPRQSLNRGKKSHLSWSCGRSYRAFWWFDHEPFGLFAGFRKWKICSDYKYTEYTKYLIINIRNLFKVVFHRSIRLRNRCPIVHPFALLWYKIGDRHTRGQRDEHTLRQPLGRLQ